MKKLTIIVILIALILLLVPPVLGMQAQSRLEQGLAQASEQSGEFVEMTLEDYESGWFTSSGKIRFRVTDAYLEANPVLTQQDADGNALADWLRAGFAQDIDVAHGPLLLGQQTGLGLGEVVTTLDGSGNPELAAMLEKTGNEYFMRTSLVIGFGGAGDLAMEAPTFQLTQPDDDIDSIVFAGASATGNLDMASMHVVMDGQMNGLSFTGVDGEAVMERTTFSADIAYPESDPYGLGTGEMELDRFVAISGNETAVDLRQAKVAFASSRNDNDKVSLSLTYLIEKFASAGVSLEDMEVTFIMDNLDAATLVRMQELSSELGSSPNDPAQLLAVLTEPTYELLAGGAALRFDPIRFTYNKQPFAATVKLHTKPANLPPKDAFTFDNPLLFLNLFTVDADLSIDRALALEMALPQVRQQLAAGIPEGTEIDAAQLEEMARAQAPMMLGTLVGQGLLREEDNNYVLKASYDNGALLVNDNPFPLGAMLGGEG